MPSLASERGSFLASFEGIKSAQNPHKLGNSARNMLLKRPRTRLALLKVTQQQKNTPGTPRKCSRKARSQTSRLNSPVIDLTLDDHMGDDRHSSDGSPLKCIAPKLKLQKKQRDTDSIGGTFEINHKPGYNDSSTGSNAGALPQSNGTAPSNYPSRKVLLATNAINHALVSNSLAMHSPPLELNLFPIRTLDASAHFPYGDLCLNFPLLSLPTKKVKSVAFSDSVTLDTPSLPLYDPKNGGLSPFSTPKRSILKHSLAPGDSSPIDPNDLSMWVKSSRLLNHQRSNNLENHSPDNPLFWQPGTIIQLEPKSVNLPQLVDGCVEVLKHDGFDKKFEVYATMNLVCRSNDISTVMALFLGKSSPWLLSVEKHTGYKPRASLAHLKALCRYAKRDMETIEGGLYVKNETPSLEPARNDPFEARALTQTLKLMECFLAMPAINVHIPAADIKWVYAHACDVIVKPTLSKSLVSPYLSILKDYHFPAKKRKLLFESYPHALLEKILSAVLNMKHYLSSSLINEKFVALRNLILHFPAVLAKHFHLWFPGLLVNLCDVSFVLYLKVVGAGITTLLGAAWSYLDHNDICLYARKFLEAPLAASHKSWVSESLSFSSSEKQPVAIDYVVESLRTLLDGGFHKYAMDIWVAVTLLLGRIESGIDSWRHLDTWLQVHKICLGAKSAFAKEVALDSWKAVVYRICNHDLRDLRLFVPVSLESPNKVLAIPNTKVTGRAEDVLSLKIRLLIHPLMAVSSLEFFPQTDPQNNLDLVRAVHNCFLSILYSLLSHHPKLNAKYFHVVWDRIVQPVLLSFYLKKKHPNAQMHRLALAIMSKLLKPSASNADKAYTGIRCLSQEPVNVSEIASLNPRWVYLRFDKVLPIASVLLRLKQVTFDAKAELFLCFLDAVRAVTRKEVLVSDTTLDLIDNLPLCVDALLSNGSEVTYNALNRVILSLNDTFGAANLVSMTAYTRSVVEPLLVGALLRLTVDQTQSIIGMWYSAIGDKKNVKFLSILHTINKDVHSVEVAAFIAESLNHKKTAKFSPEELALIGAMFQEVSSDFSAIAKKIIQQIVLLKADEFESMISRLRIVHWHINIFTFFVVLMHDAPYDYLKQATVALIGERVKETQDFEQIVEVLLVNYFDFEVHCLRRDIVATVVKNPHLEKLQTAWGLYIAGFSSDLAMLDDVLECAVHAGVEVKILVGGRLEKLPKVTALLESQTKGCLNQSVEAFGSSLNGDNSAETILYGYIFEQNSMDSSGQSAPVESDSSLEKVALIVAQKKVESSNGRYASSDPIAASSDDRDDSQVPQIEQDCRSSESNESLLCSLSLAEQPEDAPQTVAVQKRTKGSESDSMDADKDKENKSESRKRKYPRQRLQKSKRLHSNQSSLEDIKQVSESENSSPERSHYGDSLKPNKGAEITSSSEERREAGHETKSSENNSAENLFQDQQSFPHNSTDKMDIAVSISKGSTLGHEILQPISKLKVVLALHELFDQFKDADLAGLAEREKYDLETAMMQFILRMRKAGGDNLSRREKWPQKSSA